MKLGKLKLKYILSDEFYCVHANEDEILIYKKIQPDFDDGLGNI